MVYSPSSTNAQGGELPRGTIQMAKSGKNRTSVAPSARSGPRSAPVSRATLTRLNLSHLLREIREVGPTSRSSLAAATGLNKATISRLVDRLIQMKLVHETGEQHSNGRGRRPVLLEINPEAGFIVSAEIGVDFLLVACSDFGARLLWRRFESWTESREAEEILNRCWQLLRKAISFGETKLGRFFGLALGVPGLVNSADGTLFFAPNLGWRNVPLGRMLRERFDVSVFVENEANLAALGEYYFGAAKGYDDVLYISAGVGVGGGLVHHGRLVTGTSGVAGEFGHMTLDPDGLPCRCGNRGCWETMASQSALFRRIQELAAAGNLTHLAAATGGDWSRLTVPMVISAAEAGDIVAIDALRDIGVALGIGIASLINALNPDLVVFGGSLSTAGPLIFPALKQEVERRALAWSNSAAQLVYARNGQDNCVLGGVARVCEWVIHHPVRAVHHAEQRLVKSSAG